MAETNPLKTTTIPLYWIAILRLMLGVLFLSTWASNLGKGFYTPDGLLNFFTEVFPQSSNPLAFYATFINQIILPMRYVFAPFQLVAELLLGLLLLLGVLTPLVSLAAGFFILNTFLATFGHDWPWSYLTILAILGITFITHAGRSLGIDAWFCKRWGEPPFPFLW